MWKEVFPDYYVSRCGQVLSRKGGKERLKKPTMNTHGYLQVAIWHGGKQTQQRVHRLVALAWVPGDSSLSVNHKDGNKLNNDASNLEWVTAVENHRIHFANQAARKAHKPGAVLTWGLVREIRKRLSTGEKQAAVADVYGMSASTISRIATRDLWKE